MRAFILVRDVDVTGISGTGVVAEGVEFEDGTTVLRWLPAGTTRPDRVKPTTVIHESVQSVVNLHGHDNRTWVQFADDIIWPPAGEGRPERLAAPEAERSHEQVKRAWRRNVDDADD